MRCPLTPEQWQHYFENGDPLVEKHLASCAACRAEAEDVARLTAALTDLPMLATPERLPNSFQQLATATAGRHFTCDDAVQLIDAWVEGDLSPAQAFLMEDHLLWCPTCTAEVARAEQVAGLLHGLPTLDAPAVIAERLVAARRPWWQRVADVFSLPAQLPRYGLAGAALAACLLLAVMVTHNPSQQPVAKRHVAPVTAVASKISPERTMEQVATVLDTAKEAVNAVVRQQGKAPVVAVARGARRPAVTGTLRTGSGAGVAESLEKHPATSANRVKTPAAPVKATVPSVDSTKTAPETSPARTDEPAAPNEYVASAREALLYMAREAELASMEEAQTNVPDTLIAALPPRAERVSRVTPAPREVLESTAVRAEELSRSINEDLRRQLAPTRMRPISTENDTAQAHADGMLRIISTR